MKTGQNKQKRAVMQGFKLSAEVAALALGSALSVNSSWAQTSIKPALTATPAAAAASASASAPASASGKVIPDIWVIKSEQKYIPEWLPTPKPVLTAESVQQLRAIPCVAEFAARRQAGFLALRAKDGKPLDVTLFTFDTPAISARGWQLSSQAAAPNTYYLTADVATRLGLPPNTTQGQMIAPISFTPSVTTRVVKSMKPSTLEELTVKPVGDTAPPAVPYGGTFGADTKLLNEKLTGMVLQFAPIFRSQHEKWTVEQRSAQQHLTTTLYARTKPGLSATAREACRVQLQAHTKIWEAGMPTIAWEVVPLTD